VLNGNVPLTDRQKSDSVAQKRHQSVDRKEDGALKKRLILQKGGFLSAILPPVLGVLANIIQQ